MKISIFSFTTAGTERMRELTKRWRDEEPGIEITEYIKCRAMEDQSDPRPLEELAEQAWSSSDALVFFSSTGIAVRTIAPYLGHKSVDPAVLVLDEQGRNCISLLSGHVGGANELAERVASMLSARPVITTATDVENRFSVDTFARKNGLRVSDWEKAKEISARVLQGEILKIFSEEPMDQWAPVPGLEDQAVSDTMEEADVILSRKSLPEQKGLQLIPQDLVLGIGCRKDMPAEDIERAFLELFKNHKLDPRTIRGIASIDIKKEEPGVLALAEKLGCPYDTYSAETLMLAEGDFSSSDFVRDTTGADNVCERSAVTAAGEGAELLVGKTVFPGVTLAIARARKEKPQGTITVIGIGPGDRRHMTEEAVSALECADVVIGYKTYIQQLQNIFPHLRCRESGMRQEKDRAEEAFLLAQKGTNVAVISSGDAEVYGMAGLILELAESYPEIRVSCIPGVTAALSGGALLGAPLGHDYVSISLSDLLTPWEVITKRLRKAAEGDFVLVLYNPSSHTRKEHYLEACRILSDILPEDTVCGWCRNIGRDGEEWKICALRELADQPVDMLTTVFIGNKETRVIRGKMVTPRGYKL